MSSLVICTIGAAVLFSVSLCFTKTNTRYAMPSFLNMKMGMAKHSPRNKEYLCLTICGYRKEGMSEDAYRDHMVNVSAPMTKDLMVKYGIRRWTQIHNQNATRALMAELFDPQMCRLADFDCFSQVVFDNIEDYKRMKQDPWYKKHLMHDHEKFADTKRSMMTIGWIKEFVVDGKTV